MWVTRRNLKYGRPPKPIAWRFEEGTLKGQAVDFSPPAKQAMRLAFLNDVADEVYRLEQQVSALQRQLGLTTGG